MTKVALITGVTGQDGAYLAELLLNEGHIVHHINVASLGRESLTLMVRKCTLLPQATTHTQYSTGPQHLNVACGVDYALIKRRNESIFHQSRNFFDVDKLLADSLESRQPTQAHLSMQQAQLALYSQMAHNLHH